MGFVGCAGTAGTAPIGLLQCVGHWGCREMEKAEGKYPHCEVGAAESHCSWPVLKDCLEVMQALRCVLLGEGFGAGETRCDFRIAEAAQAGLLRPLCCSVLLLKSLSLLRFPFGIFLFPSHFYLSLFFFFLSWLMNALFDSRHSAPGRSMSAWRSFAFWGGCKPHCRPHVSHWHSAGGSPCRTPPLPSHPSFGTLGLGLCGTSQLSSGYDGGGEPQTAV